MYNWTSGDDGNTWNPLWGECQHMCNYCYIPDMFKPFPNLRECYTGEPRLNPNAFKGDPHKSKGAGTIFVCSMNDLFCKAVPSGFIEAILKHCNRYPENTYLFQSKNPCRFKEFYGQYPPNSIFGTTIETNRHYNGSKAPPTVHRMAAMVEVPNPKMVNIEPAMDFDVEELVSWLEVIEPDFVSVGADSKNNFLDEPGKDKLEALIEGISKFTEVKVKDNLKRLMEVTN